MQPHYCFLAVVLSIVDSVFPSKRYNNIHCFSRNFVISTFVVVVFFSFFFFTFVKTDPQLKYTFAGCLLYSVPFHRSIDKYLNCAFEIPDAASVGRNLHLPNVHVSGPGPIYLEALLAQREGIIPLKPLLRFLNLLPHIHILSQFSATPLHHPRVSNMNAIRSLGGVGQRWFRKPGRIFFSTDYACLEPQLVPMEGAGWREGGGGVVRDEYVLILVCPVMTRVNRGGGWRAEKLMLCSCLGHVTVVDHTPTEKGGGGGEFLALCACFKLVWRSTARLERGRYGRCIDRGTSQARRVGDSCDMLGPAVVHWRVFVV